MNDIMKVNVEELRTFNDPALEKATKGLIKISDSLKKNMFSAAAILANIEETKCYTLDGFTSTADYAMRVFNIKKSVAYNMIKVGLEYTDRKSMTSSLPHEDKDFSVTQIGEMSKLGKDIVHELVSNGEITPHMTCKEIRDVVKAKSSNRTRKTDDSVYEFHVKDSDCELKVYRGTMDKMMEDFKEGSLDIVESSYLYLIDGNPTKSKKYFFEYEEHVVCVLKRGVVSDTESVVE